MTTYRGENRFWRRYGRQKARVSVEEIESAFVSRTAGLERIGTLLADRRSSARGTMLQTMGILLQAIPARGREDFVDIHNGAVRELLRRPPRHLHSQGWDCSVGQPHPSLRGLLASQTRPSESRTGYIELWRDGYLEFGKVFMNIPEDVSKAIPSTVVFCLIHSFVYLYCRILEECGVLTASVFSLSLLGVHDSSLAIPSRYRLGMLDEAQKWPAAHLEVPPLYVENPIAERDQIVGEVNDRLWNAFGFDHCLTLLDDGSLAS
jgi:hypothetical protein